MLPILEALTNGQHKASRKTGYGRPPSVLVLLPTRELANQVKCDLGWRFTWNLRWYCLETSTITVFISVRQLFDIFTLLGIYGLWDLRWGSGIIFMLFIWRISLSCSGAFSETRSWYSCWNTGADKGNHIWFFQNLYGSFRFLSLFCHTNYF